MTNTVKSKSQLKSHENTSKIANTVNSIDKIDNMPMSTNTASHIGHTSKNLSPYKTIRPPRISTFGTIPTPRVNTTHSTTQPASRTHQVYSHGEHPTCYTHVHQQPSQTYRPGEPLSLREVKHPHTGMTYMNSSPSTEQAVLSQFSGNSEETGLSTRDLYTSQLKSSFPPAIHVPNNQMVHTCINCEHSHGHVDDHITQDTGRMQRQHLQDTIYEQNWPTHNFSHTRFTPDKENTPTFLGKQFLQGKEEITHTGINTSTQGNETSMNTCTFIPGSIPSRQSMISSRIVPQNFQHLEKDSSNTVALPGFKHNAETATHVETSRNVHSSGTLPHNLKMDTNMYANMDTDHTAHRYTGKEAHLLSRPSELRPLEAMAHQHTRKEDHLLSGPPELQLTEDPETQKSDSAYIQQTRHEYS